MLLDKELPAVYQQLVALTRDISKAAAEAGLDRQLIELVKVRSSQLNGCAFCMDMHSRAAREAGETERRLFVLAGWRDSGLFDERERAALAVTEAITNVPITRDLPDEVYAQASKALTEPQLAAVAWAATVINAFNRLGVFSRWPLPKDPA
jgi:AhpD family alkylhydroperoxidase